MQVSDENKIKKVPVLTNEELIELWKIMYSSQKDELSKKRFWKEVYKRRGLEEGGIVDAN